MMQALGNLAANAAAVKNNPVVLYAVLLVLTLVVAEIFAPDSYHTKISAAQKTLLSIAVAFASISGQPQKQPDHPPVNDPKPQDPK